MRADLAVGTTPARGPEDDDAGRHRALASPRRAAILRVLRAHDAPLPVEAVARAVGVHVNTTREHLERLWRAGLVVRTREERTVRGRPRWLWAPAAPVDAEVPGAVPTDAAPTDAAPTDAAPTGAAPTGAAAPGPATWLDGTAAGQVEALCAHFRRLGFDPDASCADDPVAPLLLLRRCPLLDLARERADVVCTVHLGLARDVLDRVGGPLTATALEPFAGAGACVLHLRPRAEPAASAPSRSR